MIIEPIHTAYAAIRRTVLDYIEGIEEGDLTRIERSIYPDLKARGLLAAEEGAQSLIPLTFTELLELRNASRQKGKMPQAARIPADYEGGKVLSLPVLGGLHHDYRRSA